MGVILKFEPIPGPTADWEDTELWVRVANIFCLICGYWAFNSQNLTLAHMVPRKHGKFKKAVGSHTTKSNWEDTYRLIINDTHHRGCYVSCSQASEMFTDDVPLSCFKALLYFMECLPRKPRRNRPNCRGRRSERLCFGYVVHSCCWELLNTHRLKALAETDLSTLLVAFQHRWMEFQISYAYGKDPPSTADPFYTPSVFDTIYAEINEAEWYRKQAAGKAKNLRHTLQPVDRQTGLRALPFELIYMVAEYLSSQEARSLETILAVRLGILFWRPRISLDLFYEIQAVTRRDVHWGRLFSKLQELEKSDALVLRRQILGCLDKHLDKIETDKQNAKQTEI
ncbi:hypothetical protein BO82DRAFT_11960 [Aspergillus uvarum CBS 121591]|uniref:Uncharacterized protein n=1 Tax=Aspergillus uvarum CBS 121591 TaxID=1448315 RepID=A0A319BTQ0_9EURO|nr:hypothetical protein BO82DRAFT_11960 [Aspergillus uvarum CBS 121591]PYH75831.1 hypothetical protein BO82DRAFT_11960 [Aspergillus uvarum CBS 121591]